MKQREQALLLLKKAREDEALVAEVLPSHRVTDDIIGFHCQQAAEKLLKALLCALGVHFARTHNLRLLMDLLSDAGHPLPSQLGSLDSLTPYGTLFRYEDGGEDDAIDRNEARAMVLKLREFVQREMALIDDDHV